VTAILIQLVWKIHNADGLERTLFGAYAKAAAEHFRDNSFVAFYFYGIHSAAHYRAEAVARLSAFFEFVPVGVWYCKSGHGKRNLNDQISLIMNDDLNSPQEQRAKRYSNLAFSVF
jgi:hypothetical protein